MKEADNMVYEYFPPALFFIFSHPARLLKLWFLGLRIERERKDGRRVTVLAANERI